MYVVVSYLLPVVVFLWGLEFEEVIPILPFPELQQELEDLEDVMVELAQEVQQFLLYRQLLRIQIGFK